MGLTTAMDVFNSALVALSRRECQSQSDGAFRRPKEEHMQFRPLHDRVVVRRIEAEEKTKGGIIIPDTAKEKPIPRFRSIGFRGAARSRCSVQTAASLDPGRTVLTAIQL